MNDRHSILLSDQQYGLDCGCTLRPRWPFPRVEVGSLDTTSLASLGAGNIAAMGGMAQMIGEKEFPTLSHEGERESIHICVNGLLLLMVVFKES